MRTDLIIVVLIGIIAVGLQHSNISKATAWSTTTTSTSTLRYSNSIRSRNLLSYLFGPNNNHKSPFLLYASTPKEETVEKDVGAKGDDDGVGVGWMELDIEKVRNDFSFMNQISYASEITQALMNDYNDENSDELKRLIEAQLSHMDGMRGFFVTFLTSYDNQSSSSSSLPEIVTKSITDCISNLPRKERQDLISLIIMNVVMPTATASMHTDPKLSESSKMTAQNGKMVLQHVLQFFDSTKEEEEFKVGIKTYILDICQAIYDVAIDSTESESEESDKSKMDKTSTDYWKLFFKNYNYLEEQRGDIASTIQTFLS